MRRPPADLAVLLGVVAVLAAFAIVPAAVLIGRAVGASGGASGIVRAVAGTGYAFRNSLEQGGLSAGLAVVVGFPAGVFLGRYRWPGRATVRAALLLPFLMPSLVMVLGTLELLGPSGVLGDPVPALRWFSHGLPGVVAVNLFYNVPIVVVLTATGCEASSSALEETVASLGGGPGRGFVDVWARPALTGAVCGGLLTFVFSALSFAPPVLLCGSRCTNAEVLVYQLAYVTGRPEASGILAGLLIAAFAVPALAYVLLARRLRAPHAATFRPRPIPWRSPAAWGSLAAFAAVAVSELALVLAVLVRSVVPAAGGAWGRDWAVLFGPVATDHLGVPAVSAVGNTLAFAAVAAGIGIVVAAGSAFVAQRRPRLSAPLTLLLFVPILLSPAVLAESLLAFWAPAIGGLPNVWLLVVLSQALLAIPFAAQSLELPLAGLSPAGRESAQALGASPWGAFVEADLPRVGRGVQTAVLFGFALGLGEFTATYFLLSPMSRFTTLPLAVYSLSQDRLGGASSAAAAVLLLLSLGVFLALARWGTEEHGRA